jgi:hypothetical protein
MMVMVLPPATGVIAADPTAPAPAIVGRVLPPKRRGRLARDQGKAAISIREPNSGIDGTRMPAKFERGGKENRS